jgi:hypothetical protein
MENKTPRQVRIEFYPQGNYGQGFYVWAIDTPNGSAPNWQNGKRTVDETQTFIEDKYQGQEIVFTVSA